MLVHGLPIATVSVEKLMTVFEFGAIKHFLIQVRCLEDDVEAVPDIKFGAADFKLGLFRWGEAGHGLNRVNGLVVFRVSFPVLARSCLQAAISNREVKAVF